MSYMNVEEKKIIFFSNLFPEFFENILFVLTLQGIRVHQRSVPTRNEQEQNQ